MRPVFQAYDEAEEFLTDEERHRLQAQVYMQDTTSNQDLWTYGNTPEKIPFPQVEKERWFPVNRAARRKAARGKR